MICSGVDQSGCAADGRRFVEGDFAAGLVPQSYQNPVHSRQRWCGSSLEVT